MRNQVAYNATGSLTQREFICNNTGVVMYRKANDLVSGNDSVTTRKNSVTKEDIIKVNALMPNPTSGKFNVRLAKGLNNANVLLLDVNGKVIQSNIRSGFDLNFYISYFSSGIYFLKIESTRKAIILKIVKK